MRRGWHLSFVTVVLGLAAVLLAGCPKRPTLAPRAAGPAPGVGPSMSAPPPAPGAAGAVGVPDAPAAPAPVPGPAPGAPAAPGAPGAVPPGVAAIPPLPGAPGVPSAPGVPGAPSAPAAPGAPSVPVAPGVPAAPGAPGAIAAAPGAPTTPGAGTVIPALPAPQEFLETAALRNIYFDFDKYEIRPGDALILEENANWLKASANTLVLIEGHCDERGTNEYNLALGERRAKATGDYLVSLGIAASRITTIS
jgi:outer membrane protein OmpA-like peptidoglycan-associated protein